MANLAEQWSHEARRLSGEATRFWGLSETGFGMISLVLLALVAIAASLMCPAIDWTATGFLVGP
jgi:hypothetical protein